MLIFFFLQTQWVGYIEYRQDCLEEQLQLSLPLVSRFPAILLSLFITTDKMDEFTEWHLET